MINEQVNKTRYKMLFNKMLIESNDMIRLNRITYKNGIKFNVSVNANSILNQYMVRI